MAHTLAAHLGARHFNAAAVADLTLVADALVPVSYTHLDVYKIQAGLHGILAAALRFSAQVGGVTEHIGQRNERIDLLRAAAGLGALDLAAPGIDIADNVAHRCV